MSSSKLFVVPLLLLLCTLLVGKCVLANAYPPKYDLPHYATRCKSDSIGVRSLSIEGCGFDDIVCTFTTKATKQVNLTLVSGKLPPARITLLTMMMNANNLLLLPLPTTDVASTSVKMMKTLTSYLDDRVKVLPTTEMCGKHAWCPLYHDSKTPNLMSLDQEIPSDVAKGNHNLRVWLKDGSKEFACLDFYLKIV